MGQTGHVWCVRAKMRAHGNDAELLALEIAERTGAARLRLPCVLLVVVQLEQQRLRARTRIQLTKTTRNSASRLLPYEDSTERVGEWDVVFCFCEHSLIKCVIQCAGEQMKSTIKCEHEIVQIIGTKLESSNSSTDSQNAMDRNRLAEWKTLRLDIRFFMNAAWPASWSASDPPARPPEDPRNPRTGCEARVLYCC